MTRTEAWTQEEIDASVQEYLSLAARLEAGESVTKKEIYRHRAAQFGRTAKAFVCRFLNISYVLSILGIT